MDWQPPRLVKSNITSILAELQTPLTELKLLAEKNDSQQVLTLANQVLGLFNSLVYAQRLNQEPNFEFHWQPGSLNGLVTASVDRCRPLAGLYGVELDFQSPIKNIPISVVQPAFDYATQSLIYGLVSSLQNANKPRLMIKLIASRRPSLSLVSRDIDLFKRDFRLLGYRVRNKINPMSSGCLSGLLIANLIYDRVGSRFDLINSRAGRGVRVGFSPSRQLNLIETLWQPRCY